VGRRVGSLAGAPLQEKFHRLYVSSNPVEENREGEEEGEVIKPSGRRRAKGEVKREGVDFDLEEGRKKTSGREEQSSWKEEGGEDQRKSQNLEGQKGKGLGRSLQKRIGEVIRRADIFITRLKRNNEGSEKKREKRGTKKKNGRSGGSNRSDKGDEMGA